jgi:hypothetical protein
VECNGPRRGWRSGRLHGARQWETPSSKAEAVQHARVANFQDRTRTRKNQKPPLY